MMPGISNHFDTMTFIKSIIDGLSLSGLTGGTVIQEVPNYQDQDVPLPFICIAPWGAEEMNVEDCVVDKDAVDYPTIVIIFGQAGKILGQAPTPNFETRLGWRQSIRRNLNNRSVPSLPMNWNLIVKPLNIVEPKMLLEKVAFASSLIIKAKFQEPRS